MTTGTTQALDEGLFIQANDVVLCVESFGQPADPAILLIHGAATPMHGWEDEFCERLAAGGRFVVRYDQRDTGRSVSYPPGQPGYGFADLVADTAGILDALELERAHFVGLSMGGGIALGAALEHPQRVASLTLIGTSPGGPGLPPMSADFLTFSSRHALPAWSDREAVIDYLLAFMRVCCGDSDVLDEDDLRVRLGRDIDRTNNIAASLTNHFVMATGSPIRARLGAITSPTLVLHGEDDPVFPPGHAEALAREIPDADLLLLERTGHLLLRPTWDIVVPALLAHTSDGLSAPGRRDAAV